MLWYIIFLRITPFLPNWFINVASPVIGVRLAPFYWGTFLGQSVSVSVCLSVCLSPIGLWFLYAFHWFYVFYVCVIVSWCIIMLVRTYSASSHTHTLTHSLFLSTRSCTSLVLLHQSRDHPLPVDHCHWPHFSPLAPHPLSLCPPLTNPRLPQEGHSQENAVMLIYMYRDPIQSSCMQGDYLFHHQTA